MTSDTGWLKLIKECISELSKYNVRILFSNTLYIKMPNEDLEVMGYWDDSDENNLCFACAIDKPIEHWGFIFAHEFCHFLQWAEKTPEWYKYHQINRDDYDKIFSNEHVGKKQLNYCLELIRDIELDCEKRTVELLKQYHITFDEKQYIKRANTYIHFFNHVKTYRQWHDDAKIPIYEKKIVRYAPSTFKGSYNKIPDRLKRAFERNYPSKKTK